MGQKQRWVKCVRKGTGGRRTDKRKEERSKDKKKKKKETGNHRGRYVGKT